MRNALLFLVCFFYSCSSRYAADIEIVLKQAGSNRGELEKVLKRYSHDPADSLKLRAAEFLIMNMPGKYSEYYDAPWNDVATVSLRWTSSSDKQLVLNTYQLSKPVKKDDVTHITAHYLINNIELAFKVWQEQPWGKSIPFDVFCEEILPYRLNTEPLENWREKALASFNDLNKSFKKDSATTTLTACAKLNSLLPRFRLDKDFPSMNYSQLMASSRGDCDEMAALAIFAMRALGIPVSIDYTPLWPDRKYGHAWNSVYDNAGMHVSFMGCETNPGEPHLGIAVSSSKIYRRTFSIQDSISAEAFNFPVGSQRFDRINVTAEYGKCTQVNIPVHESIFSGKKFAYLATPYEMEWNPLVLGNVKNDSIHFLSVKKDMVYLPVFYQNSIQIAISSPFWLDGEGNCHFFQSTSTQSVSLTRIAPLDADDYMVQRMVGGKFEGANRDDFSDAKVLYIIKKINGQWFHTATTKNHSEFRYIRYVSPKTAKCNVAEIEFYNKIGKKLQGTVIGTTGSWNNTSSTRDKAFDGDPDTFFDAANDKSWTGLDLGENPETIARIRYLPRNDGYGIYEKQTYELFYWNGKEWHLLGKKTADTDCHTLQYEAPANALYIIQNISKGRIYRRPFVVENGIQKWLALD